MAASKSWLCNILTLVILWLFTIVNCQQSISNKRLCADKDCKGTISTARALAKFPGGVHPLILSFNPGDTIQVKSKSAGDNPQLWGGEVKGQRGYFPKTYVKEMRVIVPSPSHEVDTEGNSFFNDMKKPPLPRREHRPERGGAIENNETPPPSKRKEDIIDDDTEVLNEGDETEIDEEEDLEDDEREIFEGDPDWNENEYNEYIQQQMAAGKAPEEKSESVKKEIEVESPSATAPDTEFEQEETKQGKVDGEDKRVDEEMDQLASDLDDKLTEKIETEEIKDTVTDHKDVKEEASSDTDEKEHQEIYGKSKEEVIVEGPGESSKDDDVTLDENVQQEKGENNVQSTREDENTDEESIDGKIDNLEEENKEKERQEVDKTSGDVVFEKEKVSKPNAEMEKSSNKDPVTFAIEDEGEEDDVMPVVDSSNQQKDIPSDLENTSEMLSTEKNDDSKEVAHEFKKDEDGVEKDGEMGNEDVGEVAKVVDAVNNEKVPDVKNDEKFDEKEEDVDEEESHLTEMINDVEKSSNNAIPESDKQEMRKEDADMKTEPLQEEVQVGKNVDGDEEKSDGNEMPTASETQDTGATPSSTVDADTTESQTIVERVAVPGKDENVVEKEIKDDDKAKDSVGNTGAETSEPKSEEKRAEEINKDGQVLHDQEHGDESKKDINENMKDVPKKQEMEDVYTKDELELEKDKEIHKDEELFKTSDTPSAEKVGDGVNHSDTKTEGSVTSESHDIVDTDKTESLTVDEIDSSVKTDSHLPPSHVGTDELDKEKRESSSNLDVHQTLSSSQTEEKETTKSVPLESSMQETVTKSEVSETPSLSSQQMDVSTDHSVEKSAVDDNVNEKSNSFETIVEGKTTIIIDMNGNIVTPDASDEMSDVKNLDASESISDIFPSPSVAEETSSSSHTDTVLANQSNHLSEASGDQKPIESQPDLEVKTNNMYQSVDFNSRRVLSVSHQTQVPTKTTEDVTGSVDVSNVAEGKKEPEQQQLHQGEKEDDKRDENEKKENVNKGFLHSSPEEQASWGTRPVNEDLLVDLNIATYEEKKADDPNKDIHPKKATTVTPQQTNEEILPPPTKESKEPDGADVTPSSYETDSVVGRRIDDANLQEEESMEDAIKAKQYYKTMFDLQIKNILNWLPPSIQTLLEQEPLGLSPTMAVVAGIVTIMTFAITCIFSCLCSGGGKKDNLKKSLDVIQVLEEKLQLAIKEKENIEDSIEDSQQEMIKMKEETAKAKRDSAKTNQDLQTVKLHNDTLKSQIKTLETEIADLRDNANSSLGEVKQSNKKTKEMQKQIKSLEEKEQKAVQENQKLLSDLKLKEDKVNDLSSRLEGMGQHISHLETSKEQLLSEAEDWKEKVNDSNERLNQREEEFKQMQESLSFKESELEVLKDCFLQLKSFESEEDDSSKVEEKLQSMMDVSKVNATLRSVEEERDSLSNKLQIESEARKESEEQIKRSQERVETCMSDKMKAERQCMEAQTKLSVLSSYFKEKEMQLQRELGEQEALKKQNQNKLVSADETTKSVQQESDALKTLNESLKRELASSERDFRAQIAANEKKAHENWLTARAAERELKEARHEAGVLRQKLTDLERRQMMGPGGLIRPLPTRGMPPPGMMNGPPPPPGMDRSSSRGSLPHPPHPRDDDYPISPRGPPPLMDRRGPPPPGMRPPPPDGRSPPPRLPPHNARSPPPRMPPPGMMDGRGSPPFDRRPPPPHMMDRMTPPFRLPPPDMLPPHMRDGPPPPPPGRGGSMSPDSPHGDSRQDPRYQGPPYRNAPPPDRNLRPSPRNPPLASPRQPPSGSPRQQQSQV